MEMVTYWLSSPARRRQALSIISGGLIALALAGEHLLGWAGLANGLHLAAALIAGGDIAVRAWNSLRNRHISIELLVTIAAGGALVIGEYWEASAVTFLFVFGAYLEARTLARTRQVLQELLELAPTTALVVRDGQQVEISPAEVQPDEVVWLKPGAKAPVDGVVVEGRSAVDESAITGEPIPAEKTPGAAVYAGTVNQAGLLKVRATGIGADTTLARIIRRVEEAQEEKAPTQRFIERFARWYTPLIIGLSLVFYLITGDIELALTLLVIGCPGALVISTPVSVVAGIGRAAKSGILIKGGEYLENAGKITALALDKTGTITEGKPRVTDVIALAAVERQPALQPVRAAALVGAQAAGVSLETGEETAGLAPLSPTGGEAGGATRAGEAEVLRYAAIAEAGSEHPLARAILSAVEGEALPHAESFETYTGRGVRALYQGKEILVGTREMMEEAAVAAHPDSERELDRLKAAGKTAVLVAVAGQEIGVLGIADPIRPTSAETIHKLKKIGLKRVAMLTGDDRRTAEAIAREAGIDEVHAGLLPEEKLEVVRKLQAEGHVVAMVGDGINDAPALAAADIGLAMGAAGTDVAIETADIALMADDLAKIPEAIGLSKATLNNIRQNVAIALVTVTALLLGVILGQVHMAEGMLVHEASVLVVIANGMRLLRK